MELLSLIQTHLEVDGPRLPTHHGPTPTDKWAVRSCSWQRKGRRQGNGDGASCLDTEPESPLLTAAGVRRGGGSWGGRGSCVERLNYSSKSLLR